MTYFDTITVNTYDTHASIFAAHVNQTSDTLRRFASAMLPPEGRVIDVGCGGGHDVAWLHQKGFRVTGVDPSIGMLAQAQQNYPNLSDTFIHDFLPELSQIPSKSADGVFCNNVLMHVPVEHLFATIQHFKRILKDNGTLLISFPQHDAIRDDYQRLFTPLNFGEIIQLCELCGITLIQRVHEPDNTNIQVQWSILILQNRQIDQSRGLTTIQRILADDSKNTTYKYALIRALCRIARNKDQDIQWKPDHVLIPMRDLTIEWIKLYWPIVTNNTFISQGHNEHAKSIVIRSKIQEIRESYKYDAPDLPLLLNHLDEKPEEYHHIITAIEDSIKRGPIYHAGGTTNNTGFSIFKYDQVSKSVQIPVEVWLDICRFEHWIEDSIIVRWFNLTKSFKNQQSDVKTILDSLTNIENDERNTSYIRDFLQSQQYPIFCVWTGHPINSYDIDHVIPYAVWGNNDIWNLIPATPSINRQKRDFLPTQEILRRQKHLIIDYWNLYYQYHSQLFQTQMLRSLGRHIFLQPNNWQHYAFEAFINKIELVAARRGIRRWEP